jgi:hypothetical protein
MRTRQFNVACPGGGVRAYAQWNALQDLNLPDEVCSQIFQYTAARPTNKMVTRLIASRLNPKALRQAYDFDHTSAYRDFDTVWDFMGKRLKDKSLAEHWHAVLTR